MKITEHIKREKGETLFSFEIIPPQKGQNIQKLYDNIDPLMEFKPPFIDVTTSREEHVYIQKPGGLLERKVTRMRPGTVGICASLMHKYQVDTVPHVLCGGFTREETEDAVIELNYLGIHNVLAIRGDESNYNKVLSSGRTRNIYASDLVTQLVDLREAGAGGEPEIAAAALAAVSAAGFDISQETTERAMETVQWPARMQRLTDGPLASAAPRAEIWLDGGHNPAAGEALAVLAARTADDRKATDIVVLDVGEVLSITGWFVIASAPNRPCGPASNNIALWLNT